MDEKDESRMLFLLSRIECFLRSRDPKISGFQRACGISAAILGPHQQAMWGQWVCGLSTSYILVSVQTCPRSIRIFFMFSFLLMFLTWQERNSWNWNIQGKKEHWKNWPNNHSTCIRLTLAILIVSSAWREIQDERGSSRAAGCFIGHELSTQGLAIFSQEPWEKFVSLCNLAGL